MLPSGIGILVVGGDATTVSSNLVEGNAFAGIGVVSLCLAFALQGQPCPALDVDPFPDGNHVVGNHVQGNATVPVPNPVLDSFRADLVWDGTGAGNCWKSNTFGSAVPAALPSCP